ncbi:MAG TPA: hypothetical protein VHT70_02205 [Candidatus Saccharimonadales bacterium]|jgi:hypothetical protein|nr:hypothetical protein [Candidatus Saccharimonadales bacterium]
MSIELYTGVLHGGASNLVAEEEEYRAELERLNVYLTGHNLQQHHEPGGKSIQLYITSIGSGRRELCDFIEEAQAQTSHHFPCLLAAGQTERGVFLPQSFVPPLQPAPTDAISQDFDVVGSSQELKQECDLLIAVLDRYHTSALVKETCEKLQHGAHLSLKFGTALFIA